MLVILSASIFILEDFMKDSGMGDSSFSPYCVLINKYEMIFIFISIPLIFNI